MKNFYRYFYLLLISCLLQSCWLFFPSSYEGSKSSEYENPNSNSRRAITSIATKPPIVNFDPNDRERLALSHYETAQVNEGLYYKNKNERYANIALERFEEYYNLSPNGQYAATALLKRARLLIDRKKYSDAKFEINRIKMRRDLINNDSTGKVIKAIKQLEDKLK